MKTMIFWLRKGARKPKMVGLLPNGGGYVRTDCRWSVTTSKHINQWLDGRRCREVPQAELDALAD